MNVEDNFDEIRRDLERANRRGLKAVAMSLEGYAKSGTPVDTGRLKGSINHRTTEDSAIVGTNVEYSEYVEYGTSRQKAQPFMRPALYDNDDRMKSLYSKFIKEVTG